MLSSALRSPTAVRVNIEIMRAFVRLRRLMATPGELVQQLTKLAETVQLHDHQIKVISEVNQRMIEQPAAPADWLPCRKRRWQATLMAHAATTRDTGSCLRRGFGFVGAMLDWLQCHQTVLVFRIASLQALNILLDVSTTFLKDSLASFMDFFHNRVLHFLLLRGAENLRTVAPFQYYEKTRLRFVSKFLDVRVSGL
jgi:hypothetical protein